MANSRLLFAGIISVASAAVAAQAPVIDVNSTEIESRLSAIERILDSRTESQHRLQSQLDTMQQEVDELRGAVELHNHQLEKILERQRELYLEIDKRVEALKSTASIPVTTQTPSGNVDAGSSVSQQPVSSASESEAYEAAVNLILKDRDYERAVPAFQQFIAQYPDSQYAANAHYWLGQLLFNQQQWADAQQQFAVVVDRFTDSTKRADSLLKMGIIAERLGNAALARQKFNQVISEYPDSSARKLADSRLSQLGG
ncbi:tol-pal system protein YbgF [Alteromonas facilis]|uniref:tol-pal system protein YbgF n=1 Tax=Alteromonas facilis TaxID=2048004 RepID=UPI000C292B81|nr:tol-pal system protein YbgF [Alteromonas facilis]